MRPQHRKVRALKGVTSRLDFLRRANEAEVLTPAIVWTTSINLTLLGLWYRLALKRKLDEGD
ncbi:MAG: hypothetical protein H0V97_08280 [Actinobacteria bacterium]|nr:hypothetical protein [Actinomycetota bacterium]